ncbi:MAG TPA: aerial mycelium formation protein [Actinophytocola sp.]|uniref:RsiG family protein n=1 Tax=Actinophytocola sp. TaxID=1872138 RepID=UPI002DB7A824|nr:aerial mycelium formation protein [Actinophytocola sp.]HEU5474117.1 aerial mycelium formation protein [Actinophytocola sp.]
MIEVRPGGRRRIDRVLSPDYIADLDRLDLVEVRARRDDAAQEETDLSYLRRLLHGRIDIVKAELRRRAEGGSEPVVDQLAKILADKAVAPAMGSGRHQSFEPSRAESHRRHIEALVSDTDLTDVAALPDERLDLALRTYVAEESSVSQRRREVQAVMDQLNEEIANRYRAGSASVDDLLAAERAKPDEPSE